MEMNHQAVKALLDAFDRSDWQEMTVTVGSDRLHVSRQAGSGGPEPVAPPEPAPSAADNTPPAAAPAAPAEPPAPAEPGPAARAATDSEPAGGTLVTSPSVGLFWRAPSPGAPPFVEEGAHVAAGDTIAIVEVMKLMNHVVAPVAGVLTSVLVENGATVEFGQPLVSINPEG
jgi:acetyl-CoA carboxylase biotin carboxyl carrier protein